MPSRSLTIQPYEVPGGESNTEVAISLELVDSNGAPQLGYDAILGDGVAGAYAATIHDAPVTIALPLTTELVPSLYWRFKAQWGSVSGYRSYTSSLISLPAGDPLTLPAFLALEEIPGTIVGLTADEVASIRAANAPSSDNPVATIADVGAGVSDAISAHVGADDPHPSYALESVLGTAAYTDAGDYATAAQGALADSASQPSHTHTGVYEPAGVEAADISDSTAPGRALLTAATAAAQRTALGVATAEATNIQTFSESGTWTKPTGGQTVACIFAVDAGAGGGSGRVSASGTAAYGGQGGCGGAAIYIQIPLSLLGATESVVIGAGGTGGAAQTADGASGNAGTAGGTTSFGVFVVPKSKYSQGPGGTYSAPTVIPSVQLRGIGYPAIGSMGTWITTSGSAMHADFRHSALGGGGGGGGGTIDTVPNFRFGGTGGAGSHAGVAALIPGGFGGLSSGVDGEAGSPASAAAGHYPTCGAGGGGGASGNASTNGGNGGNGGYPGGGGGGGGAALNGANSGAGGAGAAGYVEIRCY